MAGKAVLKKGTGAASAGKGKVKGKATASAKKKGGGGGGGSAKSAAKPAKKKVGVAKIFGLAMGSAGRGRGNARAGRGGPRGGVVVKTVGAAGKSKKANNNKKNYSNNSNNNNGGIRNNLKKSGSKGDLRTKLVTKAVRTTTTKSAPLTTGTKVRVSNLHQSVTVGDMTELFQMMGQLKKTPTMTKGSCVAVFARRVDAEKTVAKYNGVELDNRPMKMAIVNSMPAADVQFTVTL